MIRRALENICHKAPSKNELRKAQDYTIGQTFMGLESTSNQIMWMGESLLGYGKVLDPSEIERRILNVTPQEIQHVACHCLNRARLGVAVVGPLKDEEKITGWMQ
jgi:predicted Zn-dependent peptidase